jgi:hypothetical protein
VVAISVFGSTQQGWRGPDTYTSMLSGIIKLARLMVVQHVMTEAGFEDDSDSSVDAKIPDSPQLQSRRPPGATYSSHQPMTPESLLVPNSVSPSENILFAVDSKDDTPATKLKYQSSSERQIVNSVTMAEPSMEPTGTWTAYPSLDPDTAQPSTHKNIRLRLNLKQMARRYHLKSAAIRFGKQFGDHNLGTAGEHQPVLIEWRKYNRNGADEVINNELFECLAELLGTEKPNEFRALNFRGFIHDPASLEFGLVFDYPSLKPTSLC